MKQVAIILAFILTISLVNDCHAQRTKRGNAKGEMKQGQKGKRRDGAARNPEAIVKNMMKEFDKDGDMKLDIKELTAMFASMRQRRSQAQGENNRSTKGSKRPNPTEGKGDGSKKGMKKRGKNGNKKSKRGGDSEDLGGVKPKRPGDGI